MKFKAKFENGKTLTGKVYQQYEQSGQKRKIILLDDCQIQPETHGNEVEAFVYRGDTIIDIGSLRKKYENSFQRFSKNQSLPDERNPTNLRTFKSHLANIPDENFNKFFWYLIEKKYEIIEYDRLAYESTPTQADFVNTWINNNINYFSNLKHPSELEIRSRQQKEKVQTALRMNFEAIQRDEPYSGLIFSNMDLVKGDIFMPMVSDFFWKTLESVGYDRKKVFVAGPRELSDVAGESIKYLEEGVGVQHG